MAYRFTRTDASIQDGMRRIAIVQIGHALHALDDAALDFDAKVHAVRQHCKKLRALLRLVRPTFPGYGIEHAAFRDVARPLAPLRDASVRVESCDAVMEALAGRIDPHAMAPVRRRLIRQRTALLAESDPDAVLHVCRRQLQDAAQRAAAWKLDLDGFDALEDGLAATYRRARKAMARAQDDPAPEHLHAWRRHCQYHGYHARLLQPIHPGPMKVRIEAFHRLGERLGHYHDLAVLESTLSTDPAAYGRPDAVRVMLGLLRKHQEKLAAHAFADGSGLLAEAPSALVKHWRHRYASWRPDMCMPETLRTGS